MNRYITSLLLVFTCISGIIHAQSRSFETRIAAFIPESKLFRDIYGIAPYYQLEAAFPIFCPFKVWTNAAYYYNRGRSRPLRDRTTIQMAPLSIGLKLSLPFACSWEGYLGGGASYTWVRIKDHSSFVHSVSEKGIWGGIVKIGLTKRFRFFFTSLFVDYHFQNIDFTSSKKIERPSIEIGGLLVGLSLGAEF